MMTVRRTRLGARAVSLAVLVILVMAAVAGTSGCKLFSRGADKPRVFEGFAVVDPTTPREAWVKAWAEACSLAPGVHVVSFDAGTTYILAARGEKPTGGYTVDLWDVKVSGGAYALTFRTRDPGPGAVVTQVLSYPATLIRTAVTPESITEVLTEGPEILPWPVQSPAGPMLVAVSPLPFSQISTTALHIEGLARVWEAQFNYTLEDGHNVLASGSVLASEGAPGWGQFSLDIQFTAPTSPGLTLYFYDLSAKDGSPIDLAIIPMQWTGTLGGP